ncbi:uncharacterized protein PHALS_02199 [Plasmopara halstedii]|uniref:RXLR phytopathogen effector protein WY-domain domain-containing protein n=1 Tax=Plasmopara halstedii TaxID=4781 RepID=A0A0P1A7P1_PLAHL|nr:uncharacterized protein PHALS_02199 [Plasmopara halstedii]CEG36290.1 hypothetical protein PHALS_02199 [Plasmopara halstedii]|eukprot:XP_024572659.1 hypothetical protein PHALS_02199 [Plasmopara halstedii]
MKVVAIILSGASFCFATRLRAKACGNGGDADLNRRNLLCTPVLKPDSISNGTQRHNVERVENEAHLDDKENEARMKGGASDSMLEKTLSTFQELSTNAIIKVEELIHEAPALKKPRLESSFANQFARPQPIDTASYFNHLRNTAGEDVISVLEYSYYEGKTVMDWLKSVQASRTFPTSDDSIEKYDNTKLLVTLTEEIKPQPIVPQDVVDLFDKLQANPEFASFAEDVQRTMVLDSMYKPLVFGQWIEKGFSPEKILEIFFAHKSMNFKVTDQLFLVWLEYFTWYWRLAKSKSPLRNAEFLWALRKHLSEDSLDKMITSQEFQDVFLNQDLDDVVGDLMSIRLTWHTDYLLRKETRPDLAFPKLMKSLHDLDKSDNSAMLWLLNYVLQYRKNFPFTDTELVKLLSSTIPFESLIRFLRSQRKYPRINKLAEDMLQSMFSSTTMLTTLANSGINPEKYFQHLFSLYGTVATSSKSEIMEASQQKNFDVALQYLKYALVFDVQIKKMTFKNSFRNSFIFLDEKMHDILSQHLEELQANMEKFKQDLGVVEIGQGVPPV